MNQLQLFLLGVPQVRLSGRPLALRTRKILALLVYLATEPGLHSRDKLAELLWPGSTRSAHNALRGALFHLRAAIGGDTLLAVAKGGIELRLSEQVWVDALVLKASAQDHNHLPDPDDLKLWRGTFLDGLNIPGAPGWDEWLSAQIQAYAQHYDALLARVAHSQLGHGQVWDAIQTSRLRISGNPLNEAAYRQLAQAQLAAGQQAEAYKTQRQGQDILRRELGTEAPFGLPDTPQNLPRQGALRPGGTGVQPAGDWAAGVRAAGVWPQEREGGRSVGRPEPPDTTAPETPALGARLGEPQALPSLLGGGRLFGRSLEFGRLVQVYRTAASGQPGLLLLSGEPGIGKTRLAGELLAWADDRRAPVLRGRATEIGGAAFGLLGEALGRVTGRLRQRLSPAHLADLSRLVPALSGSGGAGDGTEQVDPFVMPEIPDQRVWLLGALGAAVLALAQGPEPLVFLIDDLQWADGGTLDALRHLATQLSEAPAAVLLLCTVRSEYLGLDSPLSAWLARVRRDLQLTTLEVAPLAAEDLVHLVRALTGLPAGTVCDQLSAWLYRVTAGHPLYATETLKHLLETGLLVPTTPDTPLGQPLDLSALPTTAEGVRAAIGERLARLTPAALALAQGAAVLGRAVAFGVLRDVAGLDDDAALSGYDELLRAGLLTELPVTSGDAGGTQATSPLTGLPSLTKLPALASLSHDRVRETLQGALSAPKQQLLHRRALHTLEAQSEAAQAAAATLAEHALGAGLRLQAAQLYERAGLTARDLGAYDEALGALEQALILTPPLAEHHGARSRLLTQITGTLFRRDGGLSEAVLGRSRRAAEATEVLPGERAAALNLLASDLIHAGRLDEAEPYALAAHDAAADAGDRREQAQALFRLVKLETDRWNWAAANAYGTRALKLTRSLGAEAEDTAIHLKLALAVVLRCQRGDLAQARARVAALLPRAQAAERGRARQLPHPDNVVARVLWELTWYDLLVGDYPSAGEHLRQLEITEARPLEMVLAMRALIQLRQGDVSGALTASARAVEINERLHLRLPNVHGVRALCLLQDGRPDEARQSMEAGLAANRMYNHLKDHVDSALRFAGVLMGLGDLDGAQREYLEALGGTFLPHALGGLLGLAEIRTRRKEPLGAALCLGAALSHGALGTSEMQQAQAILARLRLTFSEVGLSETKLEAALLEGRTTPLRQLIGRVFHEVSSAVNSPARPASGAPETQQGPQHPL